MFVAILPTFHVVTVGIRSFTTLLTHTYTVVVAPAVTTLAHLIPTLLPHARYIRSLCCSLPYLPAHGRFAAVDYDSIHGSPSRLLHRHTVLPLHCLYTSTHTAVTLAYLTFATHLHTHRLQHLPYTTAHRTPPLSCLPSYCHVTARLPSSRTHVSRTHGLRSPLPAPLLPGLPPIRFATHLTTTRTLPTLVGYGLRLDRSPPFTAVGSRTCRITTPHVTFGSAVTGSPHCYIRLRSYGPCTVTVTTRVTLFCTPFGG